jgi:molecular chaperone DnaK
VSAKDKATNKEQKITITATSGLSKDEVDKLVRDAQSHAEEDRRRKEMVEARNQADTLAYQSEKALRDAGDKVPADVRSEVEQKIKDVRSALEGQDVARINSAAQALAQSAQKIGQYMYQQGQPGQPQEGAPTGEGEPAGAGAGRRDGDRKDGETIEGEFRES